MFFKKTIKENERPYVKSNPTRIVECLKLNNTIDLFNEFNMTTAYFSNKEGVEMSTHIFNINNKEIIVDRTLTFDRNRVYKMGYFDFTTLEFFNYLFTCLPEKTKNIFLHNCYDENYYNKKNCEELNQYLYEEAKKRTTNLVEENLNIANIIFNERQGDRAKFTFDLSDEPSKKNLLMVAYEFDSIGNFYTSGGLLSLKLYEDIFKKIEENLSKTYPNISFLYFNKENSWYFRKILRHTLFKTYLNSREYLLKSTFNKEIRLSQSFIGDLN